MKKIAFCTSYKKEDVKYGRKKKSFVLYNNYQRHIERLSNEQAGRLFKAIFTYVNDGKIEILEGEADMAFSFIALQLDRDAEKYKEICRKRSESAKRSKAAKTERNELYDEVNQSNACNCIQMHANAGDNDNETDYDTVNETVTEIETETAAKPQSLVFDPSPDAQYLWTYK